MLYKVYFKKNLNINVLKENNKYNIFIPDIETVLITLRINKDFDSLNIIYNLFLKENDFYELDYNRNIFSSYNLFNNKSFDSYTKYFSEKIHNKKNYKIRKLNSVEKIVSFLSGHFYVNIDNNIISPNLRYNKLLTNLTFVKFDNAKFETFCSRKSIFKNIEDDLIYYEIDMKAYLIQFINIILRKTGYKVNFEDYSDFKDLFEEDIDRNTMKKELPKKIFGVLNGKIFLDSKIGGYLDVLKNYVMQDREWLNCFGIIYNDLDNYKKFIYLKKVYFYERIYKYILSKKNYFFPRDLFLIGDAIGLISNKNFNGINIKLKYNLVN